MTDVTKDMMMESAIPRISHLDQAEIIGLGDKTVGPKGDVRYRAPEIVMGKPYDFKADVWSFGVVLFFLMAGELPYQLEEDISDFSDSDNDSTRERIQEIEQMILKKEPEYEAIFANGISETGIDLLK